MFVRFHAEMAAAANDELWKALEEFLESCMCSEYFDDFKSKSVSVSFSFLDLKSDCSLFSGH